MELKLSEFMQQSNEYVTTHKWWLFLILLVIIVLAAFLRFYKLDQLPPSLDWDEAAVGYNAFTIANWGQDEWGKTFPITFESFGDDKSPVHVYFTAIAVKIFGLSDFTTRLPSALFGVLSVAIIFLLARKLFNSNIVGIIAALFLAVSPYNLQFSRFNHEANFALFFLMAGIWTFLTGIEKRYYLVPLSMLLFSISILSYHSSKIVVPPIIILLIILNWKILWKIKKYSVISLLIIFALGLLYINNQSLLGGSRLLQLQIPEDKILASQIYIYTGNTLLGKADVMWQHYITHFSWNYLFVSGDNNPRHSIQTIGEFYKMDAVLVVLGVIALLIFRSKASLIMLALLMLGPIPASVTGSAADGFHAPRALFMMGSWQIISAFGLSQIVKAVRKPILQLLVVSIVLVVIGFQFKNYLTDYYQNYAKKYAIQWQYGMKQVVNYVKSNPQYSKVYMTDIRSQPYIFFLYYLQTPLPEFRNTVVYNQSMSAPSNLVTSFGKYHFGDWDPIDSSPVQDVLYIIGPSHYDGLKSKLMFIVDKTVKYPNKDDAFYVVSVN